jgi:hypothetical protein
MPFACRAAARGLAPRRRPPHHDDPGPGRLDGALRPARPASSPALPWSGSRVEPQPFQPSAPRRQAHDGRSLTSHPDGRRRRAGQQRPRDPRTWTPPGRPPGTVAKRRHPFFQVRVAILGREVRSNDVCSASRSGRRRRRRRPSVLRRAGVDRRGHLGHQPRRSRTRASPGCRPSGDPGAAAAASVVNSSRDARSDGAPVGRSDRTERAVVAGRSASVAAARALRGRRRTAAG